MTTSILASPRASESQAAVFAKERGAGARWISLIPVFWRQMQLRGVDPAFAFAQSCKETGFGRFGRATTWEHHNPAGLKVRSPVGPDTNPKDHVTFRDWDEGIGAMADHLALYAGAPVKVWPTQTADQRQFESIRGKAKTVEALGGNWAPSPTYGTEIVAMLHEMTSATQSKEVPVTPKQIGDSPLVSKFVQAKHYTKGPRTRGDVIWLVLHAMQSAEKGDTAESVAAYFARGDRVASAHYNVDSNSVVQCVCEADIAYHAKGANARGIGLEHAGMSEQTARQWDDEYSKAMLHLSARLAADICKRHSIPVRFVNADALQAGVPGITTHAEVSKAFPGSGHWDPGGGFPIAAYLDLVEKHLGVTDREELPVDYTTFRKLMEQYFTDDGDSKKGIKPSKGYETWKATHSNLPTGPNGAPEAVELDLIVQGIAKELNIDLPAAIRKVRGG